MKKSLIFIAAVAAMACACSKSEVVMEQSSPAKGICFKSYAPVKGAVLDGEYLGDKYAIYAAATQRDMSGAVTVAEYFPETKFFTTDATPTSSSVYAPKTSIYWPVGDFTMDFLALAIDSTKRSSINASWDVTRANGVTISGWDTYNNQADLLYAYKNDVARASEPVTLQFKHAQAVLSFTAYTTSELSNRVAIDSIEISGLATKGDFEIDNSKVKFSASWTSLESGLDSALKVHRPCWVSTETDNVCDSLLIPQQSKKTIKIKYKIMDELGENVIAKRWVAFDNDERGAWIMGKIYEYKFLISPKEITFKEEVSEYSDEPTYGGII